LRSNHGIDKGGFNMNTKLMLAVALASGSGGVTAADYTDNAQVVSATPIFERVSEPRQECTTDRAAAPQERSLVGPIVGGVAGALLGSQIGRGNGRTAAAAGGAIAGAVVGDRIDNRQTAAVPGQRCRTVESTREVVRGYTVVYRYNGRNITTSMPYDPGQAVKVSISAIDGTGDNANAPTSGMMDGNVREADTRVAPAPVSAPANGNYSYRY
jgi:uncharacterized protein YcfJ